MARELRLGHHVVGDGHAPYLVAEIGCNHGGNLLEACALIGLAATAGAHAVKFQKRDNATLYTDSLLSMPYANEVSYGDTYGAHRRALELGRWEYQKMALYARDRGVFWFATAFDEPSVDFLLEVECPAIKLASGALTDAPLQRAAAAAGVPILLSTGGGTEGLIDAAIQRLTAKTSELAVLHCTASYPCDPHELNLSYIPRLRDRYPDLVIGYSGHDDGIGMTLVAAVLGAQIIEKHFTRSHTAKGTDHAFSLEPEGFSRLGRDLKRLRVALGAGVKQWYPSELGPLSKMRRRETPDGWKITGDLEGLIP